MDNKQDSSRRVRLRERQRRRAPRYRISVRGAVPADLSRKVNQAWASVLMMLGDNRKR